MFCIFQMEEALRTNNDMSAIGNEANAVHPAFVHMQKPNVVCAHGRSFLGERCLEPMGEVAVLIVLMKAVVSYPDLSTFFAGRLFTPCAVSSVSI